MVRDLECVGLHSLFDEPDRNGTDRERHVAQVDIDSKLPLTEPAKFRADALRAMRAHGLMDAYVFESRKGAWLWSPWLNTRRFSERFETSFSAYKGDDFHAMMGWKNGGTVLRITPKPGEGEACGLCKVGVDGDGNVGGWVCLTHRTTGRGRYKLPPQCGSEKPEDTSGCGIVALDNLDRRCPVCFGTGWTGPRFVAHFQVEPEYIAPWSFYSQPHMDFMAARFNIPAHHLPKQVDRAAVRCEGLRFERYYTEQPGAT